MIFGCRSCHKLTYRSASIRLETKRDLEQFDVLIRDNVTESGRENSKREAEEGTASASVVSIFESERAAVGLGDLATEDKADART